MSAPPSVWECRVCGRRVPRRVEECFCGARREQVLTLQQREAERSGRRIPFGVVLPLLLVGLVAAFGLLIATREDQAPSNASPTPAASEPARILRGATPAAPPAEVASDAGPSPARPAPAVLDWPSRDSAPATAEPTLAPPVQAAPAAPPPDADQREQAKAAGLEAYESELRRLIALSARMMERVRVYRAECVGQRITARITNCGDLEASIRRTLTDLENGLEAAEDQARRSWVEPGQLRDARSRTFFGSSEWEDLQRAARQLRP
jgi:hypothetical protein